MLNFQKHSSFQHIQVGLRAKNVTEKQMPLECKIEGEKKKRRWKKYFFKNAACYCNQQRLCHFGEQNLLAKVQQKTNRRSQTQL